MTYSAAIRHFPIALSFLLSVGLSTGCQQEKADGDAQPTAAPVRVAKPI
jgi:hypothetical protein